MRLGSMVNRLVGKFGYRVVRAQHNPLYFQFDYGDGGYDRYKTSQVAHNKRKLGYVWAEKDTLGLIADDIEKKNPKLKRGLCHGARNGWEVEWFRDRLDCEVIGTDIAETATDFPHMVQHDFHEVRDEWVGGFSFIYTNSLDQAFDPEKALKAWAGQLTDDGRIYIEHTMQHSSIAAGEMDPFGAHPMIMPYLLFQWGRGTYKMVDILTISDVQTQRGADSASKGDVWVFVLEKA